MIRSSFQSNNTPIAVVGTNHYLMPDAVYYVESATAHGKFNKSLGNFDIGLFKTAEKIVFNGRVQPIALPRSNPSDVSNFKVKFAGWGHIGVSFKLFINLLNDAEQSIVTI